MAIDFDLVDQLFSAKKQSKPLPKEVVSFTQRLAEDQKRMTYKQLSVLLQAIGYTKSKQVAVCFGVIQKLDKSQQYLVTNEDGHYNDKALAKWGEVVDQERLGDAVLSNIEFVERLRQL